MTDRATPVEELKHEVDSLFGKLGDDPDTIADSLEDEGYKGRPWEPRECPVAKILNEELGNGLFFSVTRSTVLVFEGEPLGAPTCKLRTPDEINRFTRRFDSEQYPDLIAD